LASEGTSFQYRSVTNYLLRYVIIVFPWVHDVLGQTNNIISIWRLLQPQPGNNSNTLTGYAYKIHEKLFYNLKTLNPRSLSLLS